MVVSNQQISIRRPEACIGCTTVCQGKSIITPDADRSRDGHKMFRVQCNAELGGELQTNVPEVLKTPWRVPPLQLDGFKRPYTKAWKGSERMAEVRPDPAKVIREQGEEQEDTAFSFEDFV